jgi:hypothetical protein
VSGPNDRIERRPPTLRPVATPKPLDQPGPKVLEVHRCLQHFQRIAVPAQPLKVLTQPEQSSLLHDPTSRSRPDSESRHDQIAKVFAGVQLRRN